MASEVPSTNFSRENINKDDEEEESSFAVKVSILDIKLPDMIGLVDGVILAGRTKLRLLTRALLELKPLKFTESGELFVVNNNLMIAIEVLRQNFSVAFDAHKDIGAIIFKMTNDYVVRNLLTLGVKRISGWRLTSPPCWWVCL